MGSGSAPSDISHSSEAGARTHNHAINSQIFEPSPLVIQISHLTESCHAMTRRELFSLSPTRANLLLIYSANNNTHLTGSALAHPRPPPLFSSPMNNGADCFGVICSAPAANLRPSVLAGETMKSMRYTWLSLTMQLGQNVA